MLINKRLISAGIASGRSDDSRTIPSIRSLVGSICSERPKAFRRDPGECGDLRNTLGELYGTFLGSEASKTGRFKQHLATVRADQDLTTGVPLVSVEPVLGYEAWIVLDKPKSNGATKSLTDTVYLKSAARAAYTALPSGLPYACANVFGG